MYGDTVDIGIVHKPDDLIGEQFAVILRRQVGLGGLGRVELQAFPDAFPQHVKRGVGFHDLGQRLLDERLASWEPVSISAGKREFYHFEPQ